MNLPEINKSNWKQRSIYFSAELNVMINKWLKANPHRKTSELVRDALFFYFAKEGLNNVDLIDSSI